MVAKPSDKEAPVALRHGDGTASMQQPRAPNFKSFPPGQDVAGLGAGDSELIAQFLAEEEADKIFALLTGGEIEFQQWYHMPEKKKPHDPLLRLQRTKVAMADPEESGLPWYRFPVNDQQRYGVLPMSPTVRALCDRVNSRLGIRFNHVVVLYYADGNDCIGYHKDKTLDLDEGSPIVSLSLGRPGRPYVLRDDIFAPKQEMEIFLPHGGLFALGPKSNARFYHSIRQAPLESTQPRVSITFRKVATFKTAEGKLEGKGADHPSLNWPTALNGQHRSDEDLTKPLHVEVPPPARQAKPKVRKAPENLSAADLEVLRTCLQEAQLERFFAQGDLKGAGHAARNVLQRPDLAKALGRRIGEAYNAWQKKQKAQEPAAPKPAEEAKAALVPEAAGGLVASCLAFGARLARWCGPQGATPQEILKFWFGEAPYKFRSGLWWRGIDPAAPLEGPGSTDRRILERYGPLIRSCRNGVESSKVSSWTSSWEGRCALVLLLDQFPRNAFRGTAEMFQYDALAQSWARRAKEEDVPWPHKLFCYVALMHAEDLEVVEEASLGLLRLSAEVPGNLGPRIKSMHLEAKSHASVLRSHGRYPHRNELLGRASTAKEVEWLRSKRLPAWALSVRPKFNKEPTEAAVAAEPKPGKLRILVLHSNRQNAPDFKKRTRAAFEPLTEVADLHFVDAPFTYTPMGEANAQAGHLGASAPKNRSWWNATDDPATMRYVGLEQSLDHLDQTFLAHGPFDGVLGFSQGGCLAGLLAAMQPRGNIKFRFCVVISGFYCRDVEFCKLQLEEVPEKHSATSVRPKVVVELPSFHSWGLEDKLVEPWRSELLAETFKNPVVQAHQADHYGQGRHHWPISHVKEWLLDRGFTHQEDGILRAAATVAEEPQEPSERPERASPWERVMKGSGVAGVTHEEVQEALAAAREAAQVRALLERALALMPWNSKVAQPAAAYWIFAAVAAEPSFESQDSLLNELVGAGGWKAPVHLHAILEEGECTEQSAALQTSIVRLIAMQLYEDSNVVKEWGQCDGSHSGMHPSLSECARFAPRFGGSVRRFALRVAADVHALGGGSLKEDLREQQPELSCMYRKLLTDIISLLDEYSEAHLAQLKGDRRGQWRLGGLDPGRFAELKATPLSHAVLHPEPMPVEVSSKSDMHPLYAFLESKDKFQPNINDDLVFTKGTITRDKRLDLCKQVIGPQGVDDLLQALTVNQDAGLVEHLLLGNNICGNELPRRIAELIRDGKVSLSTWYIAGNHITAEGLKPLCEVLKGDQIVRQFWLKRNPLRAEGAGLVAEMLKTNRTLQVLDLVNCGLLDEGAEAIASSLADSSLQHLYLDGNGLTAKSAASIAKASKKLTTLSLGMNRLYDEGAKEVCENLEGCRLQRLCLAACGIGHAGAASIAALLKRNSTLRFLDLGLLKATSALAEVPNRLSDEGAQIIAEAMEVNSTLNALILVHNSIHQTGIKALQVSLAKNTSMVKLELEQLGIPFNELTREEIRHIMTRNRRALQEDSQEWAKVQEALEPAHLREIKSVYRMGNTYSPHGEEDL